jgi:hypothetical protein
LIGEDLWAPLANAPAAITSAPTRSATAAALRLIATSRLGKRVNVPNEMGAYDDLVPDVN